MMSLFCSMCSNIILVALTIGAYLCPDFDTGHCTGLLCSVLVAAMSYVATWCGVGIGLTDDAVFFVSLITRSTAS